MTESEKEPLVCTIDRKTWARGPNPRGFANGLMSDDGTLCCLGFLGQTCGVPDNLLLAHGLPSGLPDEEFSKYPKVDNWLRFSGLNDDRMDEPTREARLSALAKEYGFEFQFVG